MGVENLPRTIWWERGDQAGGSACVCMVDQRLLPQELVVLRCTTVSEVCDAIATMAVRGAPALGVAAAMALAVWAVNEYRGERADAFVAELHEVAARVASVRPTAVNLAWGAEQVVNRVDSHRGDPVEALKDLIVRVACELCADDENRCRSIGTNALPLLERLAGASGESREGGVALMTHCNAGSLATAFYGTATGVIYAGFEAGLVSHVWVRETRPVNQGGRLTAWEMQQVGVPATLICDSAAASLMAAGRVDAVVVGADRICANGDVINKIGTYDLACLCRIHDVPLYVAAPNSTLDLTCARGADVVIEQRDAREVAGVTVDGTWHRTTPEGIAIANPAFDVTPAGFVSAIITERGIFVPHHIAASLQEQ